MNKTMLNTERLALAVALKRGQRGLRAVAQECGVSAATLSRVERGLTPDAVTFIRLISWLRMPFMRFVISDQARNGNRGTRERTPRKRRR